MELKSGEPEAGGKKDRKKSTNWFVVAGFVLVALFFFVPKLIELYSLNLQQAAAQDAVKYHNSPDCTVFSGTERDECYLTHAVDAALRKKVDSGDCSKIVSEVTKSQCEKYVLRLIDRTGP